MSRARGGRIETGKQPSVASVSTDTNVKAPSSAIASATTGAVAPSPIPCEIQKITSCCHVQTICFVHESSKRVRILHSPTACGMGYYDESTFQIEMKTFDTDLPSLLSDAKTVVRKIYELSPTEGYESIGVYVSFEPWSTLQSHFYSSKKKGGMFGKLISRAVDYMIPPETLDDFFTDESKALLANNVVSTFFPKRVGTASIATSTDGVNIWEIRYGEGPDDVVKMLVKSASKHRDIPDAVAAIGQQLPEMAEMFSAGYDRICSESDIFIKNLEPIRQTLQHGKVPQHFGTLKTTHELGTEQVQVTSEDVQGSRSERLPEDSPPASGSQFNTKAIVVEIPPAFREKVGGKTHFRVPRPNYVPRMWRHNAGASILLNFEQDQFHGTSVDTVLVFTEFLEHVQTMEDFLSKSSSHDDLKTKLVLQSMAELTDRAQITIADRHWGNILIRQDGSEGVIIYNIDFDRSEAAVNPHSYPAPFGSGLNTSWQKERVIFHDFSLYIGFIFVNVSSNATKEKFLGELDVGANDAYIGYNAMQTAAAPDDTFRDYWYSLCHAIAEPEIGVQLSSITLPTLSVFVYNLREKCMVKYESRRLSRKPSGVASGGGGPTHPKKNTNPSTNGATVILKSLGITTKQSLRSSLKHLQGLPKSYHDRFVRKANRLNVPGNTPQKVVENAYRIQSTGTSSQSAHPPCDWKNSCRDWVLFVIQVCLVLDTISAAKDALLNNPEHEMGVYRKKRRIVNGTLKVGLPAAIAVGLQFLKSKKKALRRQQAAKTKRNASKKHSAKKGGFRTRTSRAAVGRFRTRIRRT